MHSAHGNFIEKTGYGCQMPAMINLWREAWSTVPGTTNPNAPFGLVVLPGSGSEGGANMGAMNWAQTANYGVTPNAGTSDDSSMTRPLRFWLTREH